jgi:hypothetical protein
LRASWSKIADIVHAETQRRKGFYLSFVFCVFAASAWSQELPLLRKIPPDLMRYTGGAWPDTEGMVARNRGGFKSPEFQCGAMHAMLRAIVENNRRGVDRCWTAIDATFRYQTDKGGFSEKGCPHGGPSATAFWLADLSEALLVLRESELGAEYKERIDGVVPKIKKAAQWLAQPNYQDRLKREDAEAPNRLMYDALAYGLAGLLTHDEELKQIGRRFVDVAMTRYRPDDGVFLEKGGFDSSYQAVATLKLQVWAVYFPDAKLDAAIDRAVAWEMGRVEPDGRIDVTGNTRTGLGQERWMGREKDVNLSEVTFCLLYHYARTGDCPSLAAARTIVAWRKQSAAK